MDKRVIFAVAGSGKTTHIVERLGHGKRSLIITYTVNNFENLRKKIVSKFDNTWPENITLMTYFAFLYRFCYKPFLADKHRVKGLLYEQNPNQYAKQANLNYFMSNNRYLFSNRLTLFMDKNNVLEKIKARIEEYFDEFIIDEVQDIAGRDFTFLETLMSTDVSLLFVGDFYQHTYDTSRDGNVNNGLFDNKTDYENRFARKGVVPDNNTLKNSWRCSANVCNYIKANLGIEISSNRPLSDNSFVEYITENKQIEVILNDENIVKLHYQKGARFRVGHRNWGDSKGEDHHHDVCVILNQSTMKKYIDGDLLNLAPLTRNKLYVAITRARGNVFFVDEALIQHFKQ